jgi:3-oxoadipate enol-lactonase
MTTFAEEAVVVGGENLVLRRSGSTNGPAVVLLHPLGLDRRAFDALRSALNPIWNVVSYDQRGHGTRVAHDRFELEHLVEDAVAVCQSVSEPLHLVGHAMGGVVAALAAKRLRNVQSLAVLAVPLKSQPAFARRAESMEAGASAVVFEESLARWFKGLEAAPRYPTAVAYGRTCLDATSVQGYANGWRALASFGSLDLASTGVPTACIAAADDASVPLTAFEALTSGDACVSGRVQVEVVPTGGHMLPLMEPEATAARLENFWTRARRMHAVST